jgi:hypothetical protein
MFAHNWNSSKYFWYNLSTAFFRRYQDDSGFDIKLTPKLAKQCQKANKKAKGQIKLGRFEQARADTGDAVI